MSRFTLPSEEVLRAREKLVLDHFHDEVTQDWDATLSTFPHPHYELIAQMLVHDGDGEVREYYHDTRVAFPDQDHEIIAFRHSVDAVIVEFWLTGDEAGKPEFRDDKAAVHGHAPSCAKACAWCWTIPASPNQ